MLCMRYEGVVFARCQGKHEGGSQELIPYSILKCIKVFNGAYVDPAFLLLELAHNTGKR